MRELPNDALSRALPKNAAFEESRRIHCRMSFLNGNSFSEESVSGSVTSQRTADSLDSLKLRWRCRYATACAACKKKSGHSELLKNLTQFADLMRG